MKLTLWLWIIAGIALPWLGGCGGTSPEKPPAADGGHTHAGDAEHQHDTPQDHHGHEHQAPHGGTLVMLGEETAHVELLLHDKAAGCMRLYVLDGCAENAIRIAQQEIAIDVTVDGKTTTVTFIPRANPLTGETAGDTSEFETIQPVFKNAAWAGSIRSISVRGMEFTNVAFVFPAGNEPPGGKDHDHSHDHDHNHDHDDHR